METTKGHWQKRKIPSRNEVESRMKQFLSEYQYLADERYVHKREQIYLLISQGFDDTFIEEYLSGDPNISSIDLDFVRCLANLAGEDFVRCYLYKKEFSYEEAIGRFKDYVCEQRFEDYPKLIELKKSHEKQEENFKQQVEFMKREMENSRELLQQLVESEKAGVKKEMEVMRLIMQSEIDGYNAKLEEAERHKGELEEKNLLLQEQLDKKSAEETEAQMTPTQDKELEDLRKRCKMLEEQARRGMIPDTDKCMEGIFREWWQKQRKKREEKAKADRFSYILQVCGNPEFNKEQLNIITQVVRYNLPVKDLKKICDPKLPSENMGLMASFLLKQNGYDEKIITGEY